MPATSEKQRKLFGAALAVKRGSEPISKKVANIAKGTSEKELSKMASKKESMEDGAISQVFAVTKPHDGCTQDSLVQSINPLSGISNAGITPDQVHGVYPDVDQARVVSERLFAEFEESQRMLEEKKSTVTDRLKKAIDKLEKKRKQHMDSVKEDPKNASSHRDEIANVTTKIDELVTKLEKIEKSKKAEEKKDAKEGNKSLKEGFKSDNTDEEKNHYTSKGYISNLEQAWRSPKDAYRDLSTFLKDIAFHEDVYGKKELWIKNILLAVEKN